MPIMGLSGQRVIDIAWHSEAAGESHRDETARGEGETVPGRNH